MAQLDTPTLITIIGNDTDNFIVKLNDYLHLNRLDLLPSYADQNAFKRTLNDILSHLSRSSMKCECIMMKFDQERTHIPCSLIIQVKRIAHTARDYNKFRYFHPIPVCRGDNVTVELFGYTC